MKSFLKKIVLTFVLISSGVLLFAQSVSEQIGVALGSGNVSGITRYFDNAVSISVSGSQSTYSRSQAEMVLRDFFGKNQARGFTAEHSGGSKGSSYAIGTLTTANGKYRAYFTVRQKENGYIIQEIRIEK